MVGGQPASANDLYRRLYLEAVDHLCSDLDSRYSAGDSALADAECALITADAAMVARTGDCYGLDRDTLQLHFNMLQDICTANKMPCSSHSRTSIADLVRTRIWCCIASCQRV